MFKSRLTLASLGAILCCGHAAAGSGLASDAKVDPSGAALSSFFWGDYDGDGLADAVVLQPGADLRLLHNTGRGGFEDVTETVGLDGLAGVRQALWSDFDGDGQLDLFLAAPRGESRLLRNAGGVSFAPVGEESGLVMSAAVYHAEWIDFDTDERPDLFLATAERDVLFRNRGAGSFEEVRLQLPEREARITGALGAVVTTPAAAAPSTPDPDRPAPRAPGRRGGRTPVSGLGVTTTPAPPATPNPSGPFCPPTIDDFSNPGNCLSASTVPTLGMLYPLGDDFNIDGAGQVGIGTLTPGAKLDVAGDVRSSGRLISTALTGPPLSVASDEWVFNLNADKLDGVDASDFSQFGLAVESAEILDGTVGTADLANDAVTGDKLATGSVTTDSILDNSVFGVDLAGNSVDSVHIRDNAVGSSEIAPDSITASDIGSSAVGASEIASNAVGASEIASNAVGSSEIASNAVGSSEVIDNSLTASDLASNSVGSSELASGAVNYVELASPLERSSSGMVLWGRNTSTSSQADGIKIETAGSSGVALEALATSTGSGAAYGVKGLAASQYGTGVWGRANHTTGSTFGVKGENYSSSGAAVKGQSYATTGAAYGVYAETPSSSGQAIYAEATSLSGTTYGVRAFTNAPAGVVLRGESHATTGNADGVWGETNGDSSYAYGVYGRYANTAGAGQGVRGWSNSAAGYGVYSSGNFGASGTKSFVSPHPEDASKEIRFVCLEGNESGTYFRGSSVLVDGLAEIVVPEAFRLVSEEEGLSIQLTAVGAPTRLWAESQDLDRIVVRGDIDAPFHYFVNGVRRGFAEFETIRENSAFVPEVRGVPYGNQYPEAFRRLLVENGILNADFTPNGGTAAANGWTLRDPEFDEEGHLISDHE